MIAPALLLILFAFLELSWLLSDLFILHAAARAAVRCAAVGAPTGEILEKVFSVAQALDRNALTVSLEYRTEAGEQGWGNWQPLGDTNEQSRIVNDAPAGAEIRVALVYRHPILIPGLFSALGDPADPSTRTLEVSAVMRRE